jgi:hypothetical protein
MRAWKSSPLVTFSMASRDTTGVSYGAEADILSHKRIWQRNWGCGPGKQFSGGRINLFPVVYPLAAFPFLIAYA